MINIKKNIFIKNKCLNIVCCKVCVVVVCFYIVYCVMPFTIINNCFVRCFSIKSFNCNNYTNEIVIDKGRTHRLILITLSNNIEYVSENDNIAQVSWMGVVRGVGCGETCIYIHNEGEIYKCLIKVE